MTAMYDMANLTKLAPLGAAAPAAMAALQALDKVALAEGVIPQKYREQMAIAVALTTQCPYCLEVHRKAAEAAGATHKELAEAAFVAVALPAGAAFSHASHLISG